MVFVSAVSTPADEHTENEDAFSLADGIGVVVDGAGIPRELRSGCCHTVAWYANALANAFRDHLERRNSDMRRALAEAIADVRASHQARCRLEEGSPSATVAAWRLTPDAVEYLVLCDASIILSLRDGTVDEVTDDRIARVTAPLIQTDVPDEVRSARAAAVERTRNRPGGFWCCHHDPAAAYEARHGHVDRDAVRAVIAASDGATRGHQLLDALPIQGLVQSVLADDAPAAIRTIRQAERDNESLVRNAMKRHDDATLVALLLTPGRNPEGGVGSGQTRS